MWYHSIPDMDLFTFLEGVVHLFGFVLRAAVESPFLLVFVGLAVLMVAVALFQMLYQSAKKSR